MKLFKIAMEDFTNSFKIKNIAKLVKDPKGLLKWMSKNIKYGYMTNKNKKSFSFSKMDTDYVFQSPDKLIDSGVGICWDQAELERSVLDILKIKNRCYYLETVPFEQTHVFVLFNAADGIYWLENSFSKHHGIHGPFNSDVDAIKEIGTCVKNNTDNKEINKINYCVLHNHPKDGSSTNEYFDFIRKNSFKELSV